MELSKGFIKKYGCFFAVLSLFILSPTLLSKPHYASIVMEYPSGNVLFSENPTIQNQPASLTKVMTLYLVFKALDHGALRLSDQLRVSAHAASQQPSKLGLRPNDSISVEDAISGLVTKSANDAAAVLAENMAPSEEDFAILMTEQAQRLGMTGTTFKNASGIAESGQFTTAKDMATLGAAIMRDYPHFYHFFALRKFTFNDRTYTNHNHLLGKYEGCDGIKTGFTAASGFNLLSSATRDGHRLIAVVLGGDSIKSRDLRTMQLLDIGFTKLSNNNNKVQHAVNSKDIERDTQLELEAPNTTLEEEY